MSIEKLDFQSVIKEEMPFTMVLNSVIQNIQDPIAGFVWVYLSSLPPSWRVNKSQLMKHFNIGQKKLRQVFSYLRRSNLIAYEQLKNERGEFGEHAIKVLNGTIFVKEIAFIGEHEAAEAESDPADFTGGAKPARAENGTGGKDTPIKETLLIKENEKKERESILSHFENFIPNNQAVDLCYKKGIDPQLVLNKFKTHHIGRGSYVKLVNLDAAFYNWVLNERSNQQSREGRYRAA